VGTIKVDREDFKALCAEHGVGPHPEYSGRGMFGEACVGVYGSTGDLVAFVTDAASLTGDDRAPWRHPSSDSLGLSTIWYWPGIQTD
jgi:hypothetical protein